MPRKPRTRCNLSWEDRFGTIADGNLPQYKVTMDLCGVDISAITYPDIHMSDFHYYHMKCPYSVESELHYVRNTNINDVNYFDMEDVTSGTLGLSTHTSTKGIMIKEQRGRKYGWLCVDPACPYHIATGNYYFYI